MYETLVYIAAWKTWGFAGAARASSPPPARVSSARRPAVAARAGFSRSAPRGRTLRTRSRGQARGRAGTRRPPGARARAWRLRRCCSWSSLPPALARLAVPAQVRCARRRARHPWEASTAIVGPRYCLNCCCWKRCLKCCWWWNCWRSVGQLALNGKPARGLLGIFRKERHVSRSKKLPLTLLSIS